ncbi:putative diguanylate cyclase YdaM [Rubripirellula lacrimiformis]|uniref:diguanylate cyclase n=1 Tax=Rubripirellula lacrimiformis TaxID=1930273 RepID=A0A517N6Q1_9BACT|nr:GGDEF domain-containing protein [Rubripirellula lacrimiformis]QDT02829.1 putative diguanylate cyclase YdaM [Rubripirellula lacrimiformis]
MWLDLMIVMSCGGAGLACGWVMHATNAGASVATTSPESVGGVETGSPASSGDDGEPSREKINEVADRLRAYAQTMAEDVDAHQTAVQAVNNSLTSDESKSPESVFQAITQLIEANEVMQSQLRTAQDRIHAQSAQIQSAERRAMTDALTLVPNRGAFDKHLARQHDLGGINAGTLAVLDVDNFKKFNDVCGHRAGDEVLKVVANMLHSKLNQYGIVARFGGEEFAVILDGCPIERAKELVEAARAEIAERDILFEDKRLRVTASAGVAELAEGESSASWLERADKALYRSKKAGRDCGHWMDHQTPVKIEPSIPLPAPPTVATTPVSPVAAVLNTASTASVKGSAAQPKPKKHMGLPGRADLAGAFDEIRNRTQSNVSMFVMAIRCNTEANPTAMRSLMQIVRATLRSVDRLGCDDESTFLVFMLSADESTAEARSLQICRSVSAIGLDSDSGVAHPVSIGVSQVRSDEGFEGVVERCVALAVEAKDVDGDPVRMESFV